MVVNSGRNVFDNYELIYFDSSKNYCVIVN